MGLLLMALIPSCAGAQGLRADDPSLFHFGSSEQMMHGQFRGFDYVESCWAGDGQQFGGSKIVSIKYKDFIYVAWTGVFNSVNIACLGSTHLKELTQGNEAIDRNVYHGGEDTLAGRVFANYTPTMALYQDKLYIFYNDYKDNNRIHYLVISEEGSVKISERGVVPGTPTDLVNITALSYPQADGIAFIGTTLPEQQLRFFLVGTVFLDRRYQWAGLVDKKLGEQGVGTVGICEANQNQYLIAWTGVDNGHQLNSAYLDKQLFTLSDKHTYTEHSAHLDGPLLFRKENQDDKDIHILWRGANTDTKVYQGVINLSDKNNFKQFPIPTEVAVANMTPTLISLNEMITYMLWPTANTTGVLNERANIMIAKALDYPYQDWMGKLIKDEHTLKNLVLPGSNNAGMNDVTQISHFPSIYTLLGIPSFGDCNECGFVTQTTDVEGQLQMGYRYFGVNLTNAQYSPADIGKAPYFQDNNRLHSSVAPVDHTSSVCLGEGFETILQGAGDFLKAHPKEVVIINIKGLTPNVLSSSVIADLTATLSRFKPLIYQQEKSEKTFADLINKPIGAFRGKIILTTAYSSIADALNLIRDVFDVSRDNQYRYIDTTNAKTGSLIDNQRRFFTNPAYTGSYKRMDWQINLTQNKVSCDLSPWKDCTAKPDPGFWHHVWHIVKCAGDVAKMGYDVYKAYKEPEDPRSLVKILGWIMGSFSESSLTSAEATNAHLYPTVYDMKRGGIIRKDNMVNIIYTDASDYLYTDLCMQLLTDFNDYDEVSVYNGQMNVSDRHLGVSCSEPSSGVAAVSVNGGYPPYRYHWLSTGDTTATATGLAEGYHKVRITDAMGHVVTRKVYVSMNPVAHSGLANRNMSKTEVQPYGLSNHYEVDCTNLIAKIESNHTTTAVGDTITASVWIDKAQNDRHVKRHYQLIPARNAANASAKITLYFTQQEFDEFNSLKSGPKLPRHPDDTVGISNVMVWQKSGLSNDNSGLWSSYKSSEQEIFPEATDVVWNATGKRWEVTFHTEGFGGYFLTSYDGQRKNEWLTTNAYLSKGKPLVQWEVVEKDIKHYHVEFSYDRQTFATAGLVRSKGRGHNTYALYHEDLPKLIDSSGHGVVFYRIRQLSNAGVFTYSEIMPVDYAKERTLFLYPNPVSSELTIQSSAETQLVVYDLNGKQRTTLSVQKGKNTLSTSLWPTGMYILKTVEGEYHKIIKSQ